MRRIAVFINGGINAGFQNQGFPPMDMLLRAINNKDFELHIYSLSPCQKDKNLKIYAARGNSKIHKLFLILWFILNHFRKPYHLMQAFWGFPAGRISSLLAKLINIPSVVTFMGAETADLPQINFGQLITSKKKKRLVELIEKTTAIVCLSHFQQQSLLQNGIKHTVNIIPFGVKEQLNKKSINSSPKLSLIQVANINLVKDQHSLLKAIALVRQQYPVSLTLVGGNYLSESTNLKNYADELKITDFIHFKGVTAYEEAIALMREADIMVISSLSEGQSLAFCEAMSVGLPVVSTAVGLMKEHANTLCLTSEPSNPEALAANILKLIQDEKLYLALRKAGLQYSHEYQLSDTVEAYQQLYNKLIKT